MTTEPNTRLTRMCHVLKLNRSSFYKWVNTRENRRLKICSDALIGARIKTIFDDEHGLYGAKRIAASLNDDTDFGPINHKKVARIMKSMGLKGFTKRRRCITTRRKPGHRVMPDLVGRKFTADYKDIAPITAPWQFPQCESIRQTEPSLPFNRFCHHVTWE